MKKYFITMFFSIVVTFLLPKYSQYVFFLKHLLIYIFVTSILLLILYKVYNYLIKEYSHIYIKKGLMTLRAFTVVLIIVIMGFVRYLQVNYINYFETPPAVYCYYYDDYGNFIHGSRISYVCPTLEVVNKTNNSLTFKAEYIYPGNKQDYVRSSSTIPYSYRGKDGYAIVDVSIVYNDDHYITSYTSNTSMNYELFINPKLDPNLDSKEVRKFYHSQKIQINTTYNNDIITQSKKYFIKKIDNITYNDITEIEHFDFTDEDPFDERNLELRVRNNKSDYIKFEVYNSSLDEELYYLGNIDYSQDSIKLFYEYNPEFVNLSPKEISYSYLINEDSIETSTVRGSYTYSFEYKSYKNYIPMIQTLDYNNKESKVYELNDSIIIDRPFQTYKMYQTEYGYKVEEYQGDRHIEEIPYSDDYFLTFVVNAGVHGGVYEANPIKLEYDQQPVFNLNQMLKYVLDKNK